MNILADAEAIARDMVVALLSESNAAVLGPLFETSNATTAGETIGRIYTAVLRAVKEGGTVDVPPRRDPPSGPAGGELSGTYPDPAIARGVVTPEKFGTLPAVSANRISNDQSIPDDADTAVIYNSEVYDTAEMFREKPPSGDSRFTATVEGLYLVRASVTWQSNPTGRRELKIRKNGGFIEYSQEIEPDSGVTTHFMIGVVDMNATDFVEAVVNQTSGGDLDVRLGVGTTFDMCWLGPAPG